MDRSRIAVVIPTLNEERFIAGCLGSLSEQDYPFGAMDVMVVDGGSRDRTREIVAEWTGRYPNIRWLDNPRRIQAAAFNIGVAQSTAPYVLRLDAHAAYATDYVSRCVACLESDARIGNAGGICRILPGASTPSAEANALLNRSPFGIGGARFRVGTRAGYVDTVPFGAFRREVIERVGGMNEALPRGEDNEYNARIRKVGYKIYFDPQIVSRYYARATARASALQMYRNGRSIGCLLRMAPEAVGVRHLVPAVFVAGVVVSAVGGFLWSWMWWVAGGVLLVYLLADLWAARKAGRGAGGRVTAILTGLFPLVHVSYGIGTFVGLIVQKV